MNRSNVIVDNSPAPCGLPMRRRVSLGLGRVCRAGWLVGAAAGVAVVGCGGSDDDRPAQLPNPASVFCESQGGTVDLASGICVLPDGTRVDEWDYYRNQTDVSVGLANPAAIFCESNGGTVTGPEPMCQMPEGTSIDAWTYFRENSPDA